MKKQELKQLSMTHYKIVDMLPCKWEAVIPSECPICGGIVCTLIWEDEIEFSCYYNPDHFKRILDADNEFKVISEEQNDD